LAPVPSRWASKTSGALANPAKKPPTWSGLRPTKPFVISAHRAIASRRMRRSSRLRGWM
jgi:hypothetical protein